MVLINGRDIAEHTHDQVVLLIKASCERHSGELVLLVRPNGGYSIIYCMFLIIPSCLLLDTAARVDFLELGHTRVCDLWLPFRVVVV